MSNPYEDHPGHSAITCPLRYTVIPHPLGSSSHGYGCEGTGGHCVPGHYCDARRLHIPFTKEFRS